MHRCDQGFFVVCYVSVSYAFHGTHTNLTTRSMLEIDSLVWQTVTFAPGHEVYRVSLSQWWAVVFLTNTIVCFIIDCKSHVTAAERSICGDSTGYHRCQRRYKSWQNPAEAQPLTLIRKSRLTTLCVWVLGTVLCRIFTVLFRTKGISFMYGRNVWS